MTCVETCLRTDKQNENTLVLPYSRGQLFTQEIVSGTSHGEASARSFAGSPREIIFLKVFRTNKNTNL